MGPRVGYYVVPKKKNTPKNHSDITPTYVDSIFIRETVSDITFVRSIRQKGADSHPTPTPPPTSGAKKPVGRKIVRHQSDIWSEHAQSFFVGEPGPPDLRHKIRHDVRHQIRHQKADIKKPKSINVGNMVFFFFQYNIVIINGVD